MSNINSTPPSGKPDRDVEHLKSVADLLINSMLASDVPAYMKAGLVLVRDCHDVCLYIDDVMSAYAEPIEAPNTETAEKLYAIRKEAIEYLSLVKAGVQSFVATHPHPVT